MPVKINSKFQFKILNFKFLIPILIFEFYILNFNCYAAPCYGTKMPERKEIFIGGQSHIIFKRYLEGDNGKIKSFQDFFLLSYGAFDWLSIDLKGGAGNIKQRPVNRANLGYPYYLGGGYGFRLRLYDDKNIKAVCGFQHISIHPETIQADTGKNKAVLDDWQFSALASYAFKKITPYLGTKVSRSDYIHWVNGERNRVKSDTDKSIGMVVGMDFDLAKNMWLNLEGQFFDGEAMSASLNYSF